MRTTDEKAIVDAVFSCGFVFAAGEQASAGLPATERAPTTLVVKPVVRARPDQITMKQHAGTPAMQSFAGPRAATAKPYAHRFDRWWLAGCLVLASLFGGGMFGGSRPEKPAPVAARRPASRAIETICVGDRVVTQDAGTDGAYTATAVNARTWKKLVLLAETRWDDGTRDDVNIETLQPPEWIKQHDVRLGATVPLPLDLVEMGLPRHLHAMVTAVGRCPEIADGRGRVVLTTVNHLNKYVFELTIKDAADHIETVHTTDFHKFYSDSRNAWVSANELRKGEQLRGVNGALTVAGLASLPGVHRVYNMTVEDEHVYRVGRLGTLVHNAGCYRQGDLPARGPAGGSAAKEPIGSDLGQIRDYGPDGRAGTDYDFGHSDHDTGLGRGLHAHDWDWTQSPPRGPERPLAPGE